MKHALTLLTFSTLLLTGCQLAEAGYDKHSCMGGANTPECRAAGATMMQDELPGTEWKAMSLNGAPVVGDAPTMILMGDGRMGGSTGCNRYSGPYTLNGEAFAITGAMISTKRACLAGNAMQQESEFLRLLASMTRLSVRGNTLTLSNPQGEMITFGK